MLLDTMDLILGIFGFLIGSAFFLGFVYVIIKGIKENKQGKNTRKKGSGPNGGGLDGGGDGGGNGGGGNGG